MNGCVSSYKVSSLIFPPSPSETKRFRPLEIKNMSILVRNMFTTEIQLRKYDVANNTELELRARVPS